MKGKAEAFKEFGKQLLTLATASIIFGFLQPIATHKFSILIGFAFFITYIILTLSGVYLIYKGAESNDSS